MSIIFMNFASIFFVYQQKLYKCLKNKKQSHRPQETSPGNCSVLYSSLFGNDSNLRLASVFLPPLVPHSNAPIHPGVTAALSSSASSPAFHSLLSAWMPHLRFLLHSLRHLPRFSPPVCGTSSCAAGYTALTPAE